MKRQEIQVSVSDMIRTKYLGKTIRLARKRLELSQREVSEQVGLSRATIIQIEKGRSVPRYDKMQRLIRLLELGE